MYIAISLSLFTASLLIAAAFLLVRLMRQAREPLPEPEWLLNFSVERYRPMLRLLTDDDYEFLVASGGDAASLRRMRSERRKIFRTYLSNLIRDFNRIHRAARIFLLDAERDSSEAAARLFRVRVDFELAVLTVRWRLVLHTLGVGAVDVSRLIDSLNSLRGDLQAFPVKPAAHAWN